MSARPNNNWKHAAKCAECLKSDPNIGKPSQEDLEYQKKVKKFQNARKNHENPDVKDIITYDR